MLDELFDYLNNDFAVTCESGVVVFDAAGKTITGDFALAYLAGQYIRITGSVLNEGVYLLAGVAAGVLTVTETLVDESGEVLVKALVVPKAIVSLSDEIADKVAAGFDGVSEVQEGDSKVKFADSNASTTWQTYFAGRLAQYRKLRMV